MSRALTRACALLTLVAALPAGLAACSKAGFEPIPEPETYRDNKLEVLGELCTQPPDTLVFPLRVLIIVDASESMKVTDPPDPVTGLTARERAVRETYQDLLAQGAEDVRIGIIRFSAQARSRTPVDYDGDGVPDSYFTTDETQLDVATAALGQTDRTTNYVNALSEAYFELRTEMLRSDLESLPLSKYVVIFLSDGLPDVDDEEAALASDQNITEAVTALEDLAQLFHVGDFSFHTAYISSGQGPAVDQPAQDLLQKMSDLGEGSYRSFPNGEELNFLFVDFSVIRRVFTLRTLAAVNVNGITDFEQTASFELDLEPTEAYDVDNDGVISCGEPLSDSDGDGLSDVVERFFLTDALVPDTDDDGLSDRAEWDLNLATSDDDEKFDPNLFEDSGCFVPDPCLDEDLDEICDCRFDFDQDGICNCVTNPDIPCADEVSGRDCVDLDVDGWCDCPDVDADGLCDYEDRDGDSLNDCEELFLGTSQNGVDSDADGLPDPIEVRFRTSATERDDRDDLDWDQTVNGVEVMGSTDPRCEDANFRSRLAYRYDLQTVGIKGASTCYTFGVSNISLMATQPNPLAEYPGNGWNRIYIYAGEVAFDDPQSFARYRVACVQASYKWYGDFKNPPSGRMRLTEADFVDVAEFDPEIHCKRP